MEILKNTCELVDDFVSSGSSSDIDGSQEFWNNLSKDHLAAQTYVECLIYKYIALSCGLGNKPLFPTLTQIKNICAPTEPRDGSNASPITGPRNSSSSKSKHTIGHHEQTDNKSTPKRKFNVSRRRSEDNKKNKKESEAGEFRRKNSKNMSKSMQSLEACDQQDDKMDDPNATVQHNVLMTLNYVSKMCDMSKWDFAKLRDVFLTWNKARGWEQTSSSYEYMVMKRFSVFMSGSSKDDEHLRKATNDIFFSLIKPSDDFSIVDERHVGESVNYWEVRHKILTRPEESVAVIKCLTQIAKKVIDDSDESKILPTLHIFCETLIMSPHTPLEVLQECYTTFEQFYIWPTYVAHPVREVLDMIHMEMKSPGHFYRMIFLQDCELTLPSHLFAKMPSSETFVLIDSDLAENEALIESFKKLRLSQAASTKLPSDVEKQRFLIKHVFESVFGDACCDMATLDQTLRTIPDDITQEKCFEALLIMEEASMKSNHRLAQDYLRAELEAFSDGLADSIEGHTEGSTDSENPETPKLNRRVNVIYEKCRIRDSSASFSGMLPTSPTRNNSYLRRNTYSLTSSDGKTSTKKFSSMSSDSLAEVIGAKISTRTFTQADICDTLYHLVRDTAKQYVQEKKFGAKLNFSRKDSRLIHEDQEAYRDSGVIDDDEQSTEEKTGTADGPKEISPESSSNSSEKSATVPELEGNADDQDQNDFLKDFMEKGFDSDSDELTRLLSAMSFDQRKSFVFDRLHESQDQKTARPRLSTTSTSSNIVIQTTVETVDDVVRSPQTSAGATQQDDMPVVETQPPTIKTSFEQNPMLVVRRRSSKTENKTLNRISRFVRPKKRSGKKGQSEGELTSLSSSDSMTSVSSSTTSEDINVDGSSLRVRTSSETTVTKRKKGKFDTVSYQSPKKSRNKLRHTLGTDILPSHLNLSVRSLPSRERLSIFGNEFLIDPKTPSSSRLDFSDNEQNAGLRNSLNRTQSAGTDTGSQKRLSLGSVGKHDEIHLTVVDDDDETRRRIDSGIGPEGGQDVRRRQTASSYFQHKEHEDLGIGGVKFALKESMRANRRGRMSVSDDLEERPVYKKVVKLIFVGNDKTVGHLSRAYYELRRRLMSRAPVFQHIDLRLFFIPVSTNNCAAKDDILCGIHPIKCDIRVGELLGKYDPWYHTVVALSVNNLTRVYPKISSSEDHKEEPATPKKSITSRKLLSPQEVIAATLLSYSRFAVSRTDLSMFKINMISSSGDTFTDIFCCQLQVGHEAYKTAVKSGRYGKLGKLVDLTNDTGPPPAYTKIVYSKWGMDGQIVSTREIEDAFYHTVSVIPMSFLKNDFRGTDILQLLLIDNEKREKMARRTPNAKHSVTELAEIAGGVVDIGSMRMDVIRPVQGTFALTLDDTKIYTNIKSIEVGPCFAPGAESLERSARNTRRRLRGDHITKLPLQTFWPVRH